MVRGAKQGTHHRNRHVDGRCQAHQNHKLVRFQTFAVGFAFMIAGFAVVTFSEEPLIDHQPVICSLPQKNPRICGFIADDGEVKKVRVYFRAQKQETFYWSEMVFDGIQYCATLPVAKDSVRTVEYYIWAIDNDFETQRTRTYGISVEPDTPCEYPVFDEDPERVSNLAVYATSPKQGKSIRDFEKEGIVTFVPAAKRRK